MNYALTPKRIDWLIDWLVSNANFRAIFQLYRGVNKLYYYYDWAYLMKVIPVTYLMTVIPVTYLMKVIPVTYLMKVIPVTYLMKVIPETRRAH